MPNSLGSFWGMEIIMTATDNYKKLQEFVLNEGLALFGVADIREIKKEFSFPPEIIENIDYGISIGYSLSSVVIDSLVDRPNQLYFFHYQRVNVLLDMTALKIAGLIKQQGYLALPVPASQVIDWQNQRGHLSHQIVGYYAGHGWQGRNNLLVNSQYGSQVRYATILTNYPLDTNKPVIQTCQDCQKCVKICPAGAIKVDKFDLLLCSAKLKEFSKTEHISQQICGVCVKVCNGKK